MIAPGAALTDWIDRLHALRPAAPDPRGTVAHADAAARLRGVAAVGDGRSVSLARVLGRDPSSDGTKYALEETFDARGRLTIGFDRTSAAPHGMAHTHVDALNHYGVDGTFFGDVPVAEAQRAAVDVWGAEGIVTRGVVLDVAAVRGEEWVGADAPVTGDELDAALARSGCDLQPGDGLLVDMGRDRFEAAGHRYRTIPDARRDGPRAGLGPSAAEWIADRDVSVLCWDFLDACGPEGPPPSVHLLIWAIGLALVDNCDFSALRPALAAKARKDGLLLVAPLRQPGATGCLVNPLLVT